MHLTHYAYCGMSVPLKDGDEEECRASAARILRRRRNGGHPINVLEPGKEWEIEEREDAMMGLRPSRGYEAGRGAHNPVKPECLINTWAKAAVRKLDGMIAQHPEQRAFFTERRFRIWQRFLQEIVKLKQNDCGLHWGKGGPCAKCRYFATLPVNYAQNRRLLAALGPPEPERRNYGRPDTKRTGNRG